MRFSQIFHVLVPKDTLFYPLMEKDAEVMVQAAELLVKMMKAEDLTQREIYANEIKEVEHVGDNVTHDIFEQLNKTFITPFDREDIHQLASKMDDVVDLINASSQRFRLFKITRIEPAYIQIAELILECATNIQFAVVELRKLKQPLKVKNACLRINEIENEADAIYHRAVSQLFESEPDAIELIKIHEVLNILETAIDCAEDVSDVIKIILVKGA
ncbi:MAG: DUF47 family protein [Bacteroidota bacterium]